MSPAAESAQGPPVMSTAFLKGARRIPASPDPDRATVQTIQEMVRLIHEAAKDPLVQAFAMDAVRSWRGGIDFAMSGRDPFTDPLAIAESCFWQAKHHMRFVHHSKQILVLFHEVDQLQLLISPDVLVRMNRMEGDCAIYTLLVCAMLEALGVMWELHTLAVDPGQPTIFSHVFLRVVLPSGRRIPLDASHGAYLGWMVPSSDILRSQVWDESGNPVGDGGQFSGLHGYQRNPNAWWSSGFGQADVSDVSDPSAILDTPLPPMGPTLITADPTLSALQDAQLGAGTPLASETVVPGTNYVAGLDPSTGLYPTTVGTTPGYVAPSQSSAAWANFATQLAKGGMTLAEINSIQPGTVVSANGAILRQATGLAVPVGSGISTALSGSSGSILLYAGLALGAIFLVSSIKK